ncbi:hypothetical protein GUITHDRAFT_108881 [Guillardia theta CCMP2712]|uniref:Uncharacterized protein n=1 Tax=Guillardia theta (strain CCMP2712) TaxID=905079 RepID=L1J9M9_GUITC|nr:hypothetical protein GUITHDRAFT_108881 [Guillardia theta CCMP2712]EKX45241.1 hypothetical protein GUITHDRAFT_108881 [Guillardia theta CCMP2712]|eukprot:XP_005832221.1 hypothetical protein GUITHDRAFT_108881 [Guillardia theta CCMP2712]
MFEFTRSILYELSCYLAIFVLLSQGFCLFLRHVTEGWVFGMAGMHYRDLLLVCCSVQCQVWHTPDEWIKSNISYFASNSDYYGLATVSCLFKYAILWIFVVLLTMTIPDAPSPLQDLEISPKTKNIFETSHVPKRSERSRVLKERFEGLQSRLGRDKDKAKTIKTE